jgi:hypothetical protein
MDKKYSGLDSLVQGDDQANRFYNTLPDYVQDQISQRKQNVNSYESLVDYAENLLRGDI